jgi:hypothetical protein
LNEIDATLPDEGIAHPSPEPDSKRELFRPIDRGIRVTVVQLEDSTLTDLIGFLKWAARSTELNEELRTLKTKISNLQDESR